MKEFETKIKRPLKDQYHRKEKNFPTDQKDGKSLKQTKTTEQSLLMFCFYQTIVKE